MMGATFWETAPATAAIQARPAHELLLLREKMAAWSEAIREIDALLPDPRVSDDDRLKLRIERAAAKCGALACANDIAACEERMRKQAAEMQKRFGYLL